MKFSYWSAVAVNVNEIPVISMLKDRKRLVMTHYCTSRSISLFNGLTHILTVMSSTKETFSEYHLHIEYIKM